MTNRTVAFSRDTDLTGLWSGEYWYAGFGAPTPFTAHIIDTAGVLSGSTLERNTFAPAAAPELSASINGSRFDLAVSFTKLYDPGLGVHALPIHYSGAVDATFVLIDGTWSFRRPNHPEGRFVLTRVTRRAVAEAVRVAETVEIRR